MARKEKEEKEKFSNSKKCDGIDKNFLSTEESLDDDCEIDLDEDEQHKAPLIKGSKLKFHKSMKIDIDCNNQSIDSNEKENDLSSSKFKHSLNIPPPITIGKIKIFKPSRRHRIFWIRRFLKHLFIILFSVTFLLFLLFNLKNLPDIIRSAFGIKPFSTIISDKDKSIKCDQVISTPIWRQNFPMLTIESALRMIDVNNDSQLDVIVPFGTGIDAVYYDDTLCKIYFNQSQTIKDVGCGGGVMSLDGTNGEPIWAQYTPHELFASNCNSDLNKDGIKDCIIGGRMASLYAFDGRTGKIFWSISSNYGEPIAETSNFYTPLMIPKDLDSDNVPDIVVMHGGDPMRKPNQRVQNVARLMVISGKSGRILKWSYVPDNAESYYSPQLIIHPDGTLLILYGTGGETYPGGLYVVSLEALLNGQLEHSSRIIFKDCCKGVMVPPVLIDINGDEILDIIMAHFNSTVYAFDGLTFEQLWERKFPGSETYSTPSIGYFNEDDVPDFGIIYQFGPGFPIYYYAEFNILDGRNGKSLLNEPIRMSIGTQSSPLTVSTLAQNDIFLFWYSSCSNLSTNENFTKEINGSIDHYESIVSDKTVHEKSRMDFCRVRYGDLFKQYTKFLALTQPNTVDTIYDSRTDEPLVEKLNFTEISYRWYQNNFATLTQNPVPYDIWANNNDQMENYNGNTLRQDSFQDGNSFSSSNEFDILKKYKKSSPQSERIQNQILFPSNEFRQQFRKRRHVGLHNGDLIQRVISTGTLAPTMKSYFDQDQLPVDGSIDVIFATYSFPPSNVELMSDVKKACLQSYLSPEKEAELRLLNENSPFKRMNYDHDAYEAAVNEICSTTENPNNQNNVLDQNVDDPVKANDWIKEMGSMTVHRVNLKCFNNEKKKQIQIKEYKYQRWPSYLGIMSDAVANIIDE